jgi:lipopolysaccharide export LptBFGC system permease protein LptF
VYFLGLAITLIVFVVSAVTNIYEGPSRENITSTIRGALINQEREEYNRNLGIIFSLIGCGLMAVGLAMLPNSMNALRAGLLFGGVIVLFAGLGYAGSGSSNWLVAVWSLIGLATLGAGIPFLEHGSASRWWTRRSTAGPQPPSLSP